MTEDAILIGASYDNEVEDFFGAVHFYSPFALPEISVGDVTVTEIESGSQLVTVPVTRTGRFKGNLGSSATINFTTVDGTARKGSLDYVENSGTITFQGDFEALSQTEQISFVLNGDDRVEGEETLSIEISYGSGKYYIHKSTGTVTVIDTDQTTLTIDDITIDESTQSAVLTVSLDKQYSKQFTVGYTTEDLSATGGTDYQPSTGILNFGPDARSQTITIPIINDAAVEPSEQFLVNLFNIQADWIDTASSDLQAVVTINDAPSIMSIEDVSVNEDSGTAVLTVTLDQPLLSDITVDFSTADQTAIASEDYLSQSGSITFQAGEQSKTITISLIDTDLIETDETFLVNLMNLQANGLDVILGDNQAEVTIVENNQAAFSIDNVTVDENAGTATLTVTLDHPVNAEVSVDFATVDYSAVNSHDYQATSGTLTFDRNEVSKTITISLVDTDNVELTESFLVSLTNIQANGHNVGFADQWAEVTIFDDDQTSLSINNVSIDENAGFVELTVSLDRPEEFSFTVDFATTSSGALSGLDYQTSTGTLQFNIGDTSKTITIPIIDSDLVELDETFLVTLSNVQAGFVAPKIANSQAEVTINDDDQAKLSINDLSVNEEEGTAIVTVTLDHPVDSMISVDYATVDSSAVSPTDFLAKSGTLTFNPGDLTQTISISLVDSDLIEIDKTFLINLFNLQTNGRDVTFVDDQAEVTIVDTDQASLSINDLSVDENEGTATLTVSLDRQVDSVVTVDFATADNSAVDPSDYQAFNGTLTFEAGELTQTITISLVDSNNIELDETFFVNLTNIQSNGQDVIFAKAQAEVTILDDDWASLTINDASVNESEGVVTLTVSLDKPNDTLFTVDFATTDSEAHNSTDYQASTGTLQFDVGDTSKTITIPIIDSDLVELDETFLVTLFNVQSGFVAPRFIDSQAEVTIIDDDQAKLSINDLSVNEEEGTATLTVTLDQLVDTSISVDYSTIENSAESSSDFQAKSGTLSFDAEELTQTITISIVDTDLVELDETFLVNLSNIQANGRNVTFADDQAEVTIVDTDQASFSINDLSVNENEGTATLTVSLDHPVDTTVTVDFATADNSAVNSVDYHSASGTLTFNPSDVSKTITVSLVNSEIVEIDKTFFVNLSNIQANGFNVGFADQQAEVTIIDDDQAILSIDDIVVNEDIGTASVIVSLDYTLETAVTVDYQTVSVTAVENSDFLSKSGTLTFNPGVASQTIEITIVDSDTAELTETLQILLTNLQVESNLVTLPDPQSEITILDDDQILISINDVSVDEDAGSAQLTVSLDQPIGASVTVSYNTSALTATAGTDYLESSGTITFNANETTKTITIDIIDNDLVEADETLLVSLSQIESVANLGFADDQGIITIHDDDQAAISIDDISVNEDAGTATLTVTMNQQIDTTVTVDFETQNGSALNDADYASTSGTLTFNPGETTQTIHLTILEDNLNEQPESFFVNLTNLQSNGFDVNLADDQAEVTILSNDNATLSINDVEVNEDAGVAILTVSLDQAFDTSISVDYSTANLSAISSYHYVDSSGTVTFNPGEQSQTISIPIIDSDWVELDGRFFFVNLTNIQADGYGVIFTDDQARVTIREDDQAVITVDDIIVNEDVGLARLTFSVSNPVKGDIFVNYTMTEQTAIGDEDFVNRSGSFVITWGKQTQTLGFPIIDSDQVENLETYFVNLTGVDAGNRDVIIGDNQAQITILDDDQASLSVDDITVNEAAGKATLTVSLDQPVDATVTVDFSTIDQSATAPDDYLSQTGTLTFNPGTQYQTIEIDLVDSVPVELSETFEVQLSNLMAGGLNVTLADDRATVTIQDDDLGDLEWKTKLYAEGTIHSLDRFGVDIAVDGDTLISGSIGWYNTHPGEGGAFIYVRNNQGTPDYTGDDTWEYQTTLLTPDADGVSDFFGWSVDISGNTAVVGALYGDGTAENMGAVYVYTRSNEVWTFQQKLTVSDTIDNGYFGDLVAIEGNTIVVGARSTDNYTGSAYVFTQVDGVWTETAKLTADSPEIQSQFASSIDIENSTIIIGARFESETYEKSGAVFIFNEQDGVWTQTQKLKDPTPTLQGSYGNSVSIEGNLMLIGAISGNNLPNSTGKAILYKRDPSTGQWSSIQTLTASDATLNSYFGAEVEIRNQQIFVGSAFDPTGLEHNGAVYLFKQENQVWVEQQKISLPGVDPNTDFGREFAATDDAILISARLDDEVEFNAGSIYVYGLPQNPPISIENVTITEENDGSRLITANVTRTATRPGDLIYSATVDYQTVDGSATVADSDYQSTSGTLTFDSDPTASSQTQTISIRIYGDNLLEADEIFGIELLNVTGHAHISDPQSIVTITDDDQAAISIDDVTVDENAGTATLTVSLDSPVDTSISVDYATADQTAGSPSDFTSTSGTLTFNPGDLSQSIVIPIINSNQIELDETFLVNLSGIQANGRNVVFADDQAQVTIHDDDQAAISINDVTVDENAGAAILTVSLNLPVDTTISVDYSTADGTAISPSDFTSTSGTLTFNPGDLSRSIVIPITNSDQIELDETFLVNLTNLQANGANIILGDDQATVTITDDDQAAISIDDVAVDEKAGTAILTVLLNLPVDTTISVDYSTADGTAISPSDFTSTSGTLTFNPGDLSRSIVIPITNSDQIELDETFLVNLTNLQANGANIILGDNQATVTITDDDQAAISIDDVTVDENAGTAILTVSLNLPVDTTISVDYSTADGTASSPSDFISTSGTLTFNPGDLSQTIVISITNSNQIELDETFLVNLTNLQANGANIILGDDQATVTINDDDQAAISINDVTVDENAGAAILTVSLNLPVDTTISVDYSTADGTASSPSDFTSTSGTLTFNPGDLSRSIVIPITNSDQIELDETFLVNLTNLQANGANIILGDDQATVTITDDDQAAISIDDVAVDEKAGTAILTVLLNLPVDTTISVDYSTADGTAISPSDFTSTSGTLTFNPGDLSRSIVIPITNSDQIELDETFLVNLTNLQANGANIILGDDQATVTITDDDQAAISIDDVTVDENAGTATLTVSLDSPVDTSFSVDYATVDQTATNPDDYQSTSGTLIFNPGDQQKTITVSLVDSDLLEPDETFLVNLSNLQADGRNVTLADSQAEVTILDDEIATAEINVRVVNSPTSTLPNGEAATLPENQNWISEWSSYWVEIWINAYNPTEQGVFSAVLDFNYTTEYTSATEIEFGAAFTQNQAGVINDLTGTVESLSAETNASGLGAQNQLLFARIKFEPQADDQVSLDLSGKSIGPYDLGFGVSSAQVNLEGNIPATTNLGAFNGASIYANPLDFDDNDAINFRDLVIFIKVYNSNPSTSDSDYSWFADINQNDHVNFRGSGPVYRQLWQKQVELFPCQLP